MDRGDCADQQNADQRDDKISFRDYRQETTHGMPNNTATATTTNVARESRCDSAL